MNALHALRSVVRGQVWLPGEPTFDAARRPWNLAIDQQVDAVVEATDTADVVALVRHARAAGLRITTQPNGHGATGRTAGTILLRTRSLDTLQINPATRRARVGAGVPSGLLQAAAAPHGLTGLPGSSPVVSVTGVALGGGLSWFGRAHGWVADNVTAFDIVDAHGHHRHVTTDTDPDLYWALRGGGGSFAIVTALELALHPAPHLYGGRILWPAQHAPAVMDTYRTITATAPDELTVWLDLLHFPGADPMVAIDTTYLGHPNQAHELLSPLDRLPTPLSDTRKPITPAELGAITAEPTEPAAGLSHTELLTTLDDQAVTTLLENPIAPLLSAQLRHLGGALAHPSDSPHGPLTEPYALYMFGLPTDPTRAQAVTTKQRTLADALPTSGRKPLTLLNPTETIADAFTPDVINRLRDIKHRHDPHDTFRANFPVTG
ncbi:FAD binding domain-containing protein [Micromonospora citrea]|uniref:FAD binding domain-containing protein n=1 Tax=Micromonospora citrea TaxID=47855 RepID=A0A1C6VYE7_9ACTN|nr:FAD-binding oxidoreductase [Micromonospora citrea]SCL44570.1 FAD binding domain-containing protein [Micromonospora citrea]SCL71227.1 FAD binding domain-containing protein [Micromonospora citrea]